MSTFLSLLKPFADRYEVASQMNARLSAPRRLGLDALQSTSYFVPTILCIPSRPRSGQPSPRQVPSLTWPCRILILFPRLEQNAGECCTVPRLPPGEPTNGELSSMWHPAGRDLLGNCVDC